MSAQARAQGLAGIRAGIALAVEGKPLPEDVTTDDTWWGHCLISGYDAAKEG